ncbi:MAG: phosphotransferase, partial [Caldilineaceae bacterium]|nr:phosphotransferase [Caldilineaceae bacterium]
MQQDWSPLVHIEWPNGWSAKRATALLNGDRGVTDSACEDEVEHVIARLFPRANRVVLEELNRVARSPDTARRPAVRHDALVFLAREDDKTAVIVKLLTRLKAEREQSNYDNYINGQVDGNRFAVMDARQNLWTVGGHVFKLIGFTGNDILTFDDLYTEPLGEPTAQAFKDEVLIDILHDFFGTIWKRNQGRSRPFSGSLFQLYDQNWNGKLTQRLGEFKNRPATFSASKPISPTLPDPLRWLSGHNDLSSFDNVFEAIVHGDLHGENLLLDNKHFAWVIDYEDTGYGHVLRDYAELVQNIATRLRPDMDDDLTWL